MMFYGVNSLFQLIDEELTDLAQQMLACVSTVDAMVAIGVDVHLEVLVGLHQRLSIFKGVLRMHIVVGQSVAEQQGTT